MPELPEVETARRGISKALLQQTIADVIVRHRQLRMTVEENLPQLLRHQIILNVHRRAKYLLFETNHGTLIIHLGMSGSLRIIKTAVPPQKHDHLDIVLHNGLSLRYTDPRRFGLIIWTTQPPENHPLLATLGPEPFSKEFTGDYLFKLSRNRSVTIKQFLMDNKVVVGIGNIYASEILFLSGVWPLLPVKNINHKQFETIVAATKTILKKAITAGGTTLKDFINSEGKPGYFKQQLLVYGRAGMPCFTCNTRIKKIVIGQRSSTFCPRCQRK